jgi:nucleotide-binding universal stress UspA family protein
MISKILAPLDGTETAEAALLWAEYAATRSGASVQLLTVVDEPPTKLNGRHKKIEAYLRSHRDYLKGKGVSAEFVLASGPPAECILAQAKRADITAVTSGTTRWLISPVLDEVLKNMTRPTVVVRGTPNETPQIPHAGKILIALDQTTLSTSVVPVALKLAKALGSSIILCHTIAPIGEHREAADAPPGVARMLDALHDAANAFMAQAASQVEEAGVVADTVVAVGDAPQEIVRVAERAGAGLIAMATRGRQHLDSRVMGSVSNSVLHSTRLPCLLIRQTASF